MNALKAAAKADGVKRFVLTSSSAAAISPRPNEKSTVDESKQTHRHIIETTANRLFTTDTWNQDAVDAAWNPDTPAAANRWAVYAASKTQSERCGWKWSGSNPRIVFNTVLTTFNVGEILIPETRGSVSMGGIRTLLNGDCDILYKVLPREYSDLLLNI